MPSLSHSATTSRASRRSPKRLDKALFSAALALGIALPSAEAATWSASNIQFLQGDSYELGEAKRTIFTYENVLGWKYGDSFMFMDVTEPTDTGTTYYSEWSPRFSLGKISNSDLSFGFVKDVMIATTLEMGDGVRGSLIGLGFPLKIPGLVVADLNIYARSSERDFASEQTQSGAQVTFVWKAPFSLGSSNWVFEGFLDYAWGESGGSNPKEDNMMTAPRLLLDLGAVQVGVEHQIWRNKFGVKDVDEDVTQAMVKWIF